jgi:hypothetical protein
MRCARYTGQVGALIVALAISAVAGAVIVTALAAPPALGAPPAHEVHVSCNDGSSFSTQVVLPESGGGLPSFYQIEPGSGTGAAGDARGFAWFQRVVLRPDGSTVVSGSAQGPAHQHDLVECRHPGIERPENTFILTGFFTPARAG